MKSVGIITFHNADNYGACLQAYALMKYIQEQGMQVELIDFNSQVTKHYNLILPPLRKNVIRYWKQLFFNFRNYEERKKRHESFESFRCQFYRTSKFYYKNERVLKAEYPSYDFYICGSDQIWNSDLTGGIRDAFILKFGSAAIHRISYAASIGKNSLSEKEKKIFSKALSGFDAVSVREPEAKQMLDECLNRAVSIVSDPVFLLDKADWIRLMQTGMKRKKKEKYILVYVVTADERIQKIVDFASKQTGLKVIAFERIRFQNQLEYVNDASPDEFVSLIENAELIITNSFHALAISLIFEKKFWIVPHRTTNSRIENLLNMTGNQERMLMSIEQAERFDLKGSVPNWIQGSKLEKEINDSRIFLKQALKSGRE